MVIPYTSTFVLFFFQAEDGIRDVAVTGVQTCALPIFRETHRCSRDCRLARECGPHAIPTNFPPRCFRPAPWSKSDPRLPGKKPAARKTRPDIDSHTKCPAAKRGLLASPGIGECIRGVHEE